MCKRIQLALGSVVLLILLILVTTVGCTKRAAIHQIDISRFTIIPVSEVIDEPGKWEEIWKEIQDGKEVVFHIQKGAIIPLKLNTAVPVVKLQPAENSLVFTSDTYLLISRSKMEISLDGQNWAGINDFESQKTLIGFDKGAFSIGFGGSKEEGTSIHIDVIAK